MSNKSNSGGIGLPALVFILFLSLKLIGVEPVSSWSWWWVTSPLWGFPVIFIVGFILFLIYKGIKN